MTDPEALSGDQPLPVVRLLALADSVWQAERFDDAAARLIVAYFDARVAALVAERDTTQERLDYWHGEALRLTDERDQAVAERDRYRDALKFYAALRDNGQVARAALAVSTP